jgi:Flp pilus assembly protein CpaB
VRRQSLMLVVIGVVLFIAGGGIAFVTVNNSAKKNATPPSVAAPTTTPAVVVSGVVPAGTTGQTMVSKGLVSVQLIPKSTYVATDISSLQALNNQVLTATLQKGQAVSTTNLLASTSSISVPTGMDAITISATGVDGLAGYLQPGTTVDVYANVNKLSQYPGGGAPLPAGLAIPCVELISPSIQVMDVSTTVPPYSPPATGATGTAAAVANPAAAAAGRTIPASLTLLLAMTPVQAKETAFMLANETLSVVQTSKDATPPPVGVCEGTGQYSILP